jgi:hypothetical protein
MHIKLVPILWPLNNTESRDVGASKRCTPFTITLLAAISQNWHISRHKSGVYEVKSKHNFMMNLLDICI